MLIVAKIGTSSLTADDGSLDAAAIGRLASEVAAVRAQGHQLVLVTSGAIAAGLPALGISADQRPRDTATLQAVAAVGQIRLMQTWATLLADDHGIVAGQTLVVPPDFWDRSKYLSVRTTLARMLDLSVLPIINENDAVADYEIRFGDNDRIAALVAQAIQADLLVLLTDTDGVLTADPRLDADASLVEEIVHFDREVEALAGESSSNRGSGGMASKLAAAKMASWTGIATVIAAANRPNVLCDAAAGTPGVGTYVHPSSRRLSARKAWIAFAAPSSGAIVIDAGARRAIVKQGRSLLAPGIVSTEGTVAVDLAVEVRDTEGTVLAKGLVRADLDGDDSLVIHRDDMVIL